MPDVLWNGKRMSDGDTLQYCPTWERCELEFFAISDHSPSVAIDGGCYPVSELQNLTGFVVNVDQHPNYTFPFNCANFTHFRLVYSVTTYSKEYKLKGSDGKSFVAL